LSAVLAVLFSVNHSAFAATYYWDNNGTTAGFGTAGAHGQRRLPANGARMEQVLPLREQVLLLAPVMPSTSATVRLGWLLHGHGQRECEFR